MDFQTVVLANGDKISKEGGEYWLETKAGLAVQISSQQARILIKGNK